MREEIGRRAFVGTVVAGLPLLAAGPSLLAQSAANGRGQAVSGNAPLDPFIEYSVRELGGIQRRVHAQRRMRGEDARAAAQHLRTAAVYVRGIGVDALVMRRLKSAIDTQGRDAVMYPTVDRRQVARDMRRFGFEIDDAPDTTTLDDATRAALIDGLLKEGITPTLSRVADTLAAASTELDRRAAMVATPLHRVQDSSWWTGFCSSLQSTIAQLQAEAYTLAFLSFLYPDLIGAYYVTEAAVGVDTVIYAALCLW